MGKEDLIQSSSGGNIADSLGVGRKTRLLGQSVAAPQSAEAARRAGTVRSKDTAVIDLERIVPDPDQPRKEFDAEALARLAASLKARGQLQPIRVRWDDARGSYVIIMGERRWRAAGLAGLPALTCVIHDGPLTEGETLALQLIENAVREDLKPIEQARAYQALMDNNGWDGKTLAAELAVDPSKVSRAMALLDLPEAVQEKVDQGALPASTAYEISRLADPAEQAEVAERAVAERLPVARVRDEVKARKTATAVRPDPVTFDAGDGCKVTVRWGRAGGPDAVAALERALAQARAAGASAA